MGSCFSSSTKQDDPSEDNYKTAIKISKHVKEDSIVRRKREKAEQTEIERAKETSLQEYKEEVEKRRLKESKEEGKREKVDDDQVGAEKTEIERVNKLNLKLFEEKEVKRISQESKEEGERKQVEEFIKGPIKHSNDQEVNPPSKCKDSKSEIKDGLSGNVFDGLRQPQCVCCLHCNKAFAVDEIPKKGKFHRSCYNKHHNTCYVCKKKLPSTEKGLLYNEHEFWKEKFCPCHDGDGTAKCCSCERLEPKGTNFVLLDDDRWLCLQCMGSSVMDTYECHDLHLEIRDFFEGLFLPVDKQFPVLIVEKQALNKAEQEEKIGYDHAAVTRGICLSEVQNVTSVKERPKEGPNNTLINMVTETQMVSGCPVTAVLIIYGLPRLLTGYILAHEMMHAYLRVNEYNNLNNVLEEGICQVLGHMWLETQRYAPIDVAAATSAASSSNASKKGECSEYEKKLVEFCKHQIETDDSPVYGDGFRKVNHMVTNSSLKETLKEIHRRSG